MDTAPQNLKSPVTGTSAVGAPTMPGMVTLPGAGYPRKIRHANMPDIEKPI